MRRPPLVQFHVSPELHRRLQRLRSERDINLSAWLRRLVARELDRELGSQESDSPRCGSGTRNRRQPLGRSAGWGPYKLEDKLLGFVLDLGDTRKLPADLVGRAIEITTRRGDSWTTTVLEVIERREDFALVRDSGKPE